MNKYEVRFYNRFSCSDQTFKVIANNKKEARDLFILLHPRRQYYLNMEDIRVSDFYESSFYTKERILKILSDKEKSYGD